MKYQCCTATTLTLLALTVPAEAEMFTNAPDSPIAAVWARHGSWRVCTNRWEQIPNPTPWWAIPSRDGSYAIVPLYFCSPEATGKRVFRSCSYDECEYDFAVSEVLATCRISQDKSEAQMRRCADLRAIVTRVNPTFCQSFEDICPSVSVTPRP